MSMNAWISPIFSDPWTGGADDSKMRVYRKETASPISKITSSTGRAWPTNVVCHLESATNLSGGAEWTSVAAAHRPFLATTLSNASFYRLASP
jgi:hypothetical protein